MGRHNVGALLVVVYNRLLGIFTERDLLQRVFIPRLDPFSTALIGIYTRNPITVHEKSHIRDCIGIIRTHGFWHLPLIGD